MIYNMIRAKTVLHFCYTAIFKVLIMKEKE